MNQNQFIEQLHGLLFRKFKAMQKCLENKFQCVKIICKLRVDSLVKLYCQLIVRPEWVILVAIFAILLFYKTVFKLLIANDASINTRSLCLYVASEVFCVGSGASSLFIIDAAPDSSMIIPTTSLGKLNLVSRVVSTNPPLPSLTFSRSIKM